MFIIKTSIKHSISLVYYHSFLPNSLYCALTRFIASFSLFHPINPIAFIDLAISIAHCSISLSFPVFILSVIFIAIGPQILALSVFLAIFPLPLIGFSVLVTHGGSSFQPVLYEISLKDGLFLHQNALAVPFVVDEVSIIPTFIRVDCLSSPIRHVIFPLALVLEASFIKILAISVGYIILQISFIVAAVRFDISSLPFTFSIDKLSLQIITTVKLKRSESTGLIVFDLPIIICF